jgi:hypothetical protein
VSGVIASASASALALPPASLAALSALVVLLAVRTWSRVVSLALTRRVALILDASIVMLVIVFGVLVVVRFVTYA